MTVPSLSAALTVTCTVAGAVKVALLAGVVMLMLDGTLAGAVTVKLIAARKAAPVRCGRSWAKQSGWCFFSNFRMLNYQ